MLPDGWPRYVGYAVCAFLWLFTLAFFRNPKRTPAGGSSDLIAPADGVIADIEEVDAPRYIEGRALRIGIFLSVFDVHVNRSPIQATIEHVEYTPGKFLDARHPDVSHENEANELGLRVTASGLAPTKLLLRQLSGLIARRTYVPMALATSSAKRIVRMIKFGSRTELWIPIDAGAEVKVKIGDRTLR